MREGVIPKSPAQRARRFTEAGNIFQIAVHRDREMPSRVEDGAAGGIDQKHPPQAAIAPSLDNHIVDMLIGEAVASQIPGVLRTPVQRAASLILIGAVRDCLRQFGIPMRVFSWVI